MKTVSGILYKTRVYLGGNLENVKDQVRWRNFLTDELSSIGITCLDPTKNVLVGYDVETPETMNLLKTKREMGDYEYVQNYMISVISRDLRCIDIADFVIFKIEQEKPTYGSIHEFVISAQQHKPVFLLIDDKKKTPLWLSGLIEYENIFDDIFELADYIKNIDKGNIKLDLKKWKLLNLQYR